MITISHNSKDYRECTYRCVKKNRITLSFSNNPESPAEILKRKISYRYFTMSMSKLNLSNIYCPKELSYQIMEDLGRYYSSIYITGDNISNISHGVNQDHVDLFIYDLLSTINNGGLNYPYNFGILEIVNSGQTGVEEAAIKAAIKLDISVDINTTKDWRFRDQSGVDVCDKELFLSRFEFNPNKLYIL